LPLVGTPEWNLPGWEPLWTAIEETGIPAVMHQGSGHDMLFYRGWGSPTANLLATQSMAPRAAALLSCSGVLERHPDLHVVMVEVNAGWMAWTMSTLDEYYVAHQRNGWTKPILAELPSHYLRHQVHATFQDDPVALHNIPLTGTDCLLWGNDYPHPESTYPDSNRVLDRLLGDVAPDDARAVVFDNAARVFGFSQHVAEPVS
jgi:predicted TIM-barrel fold metal-dependent hydrolase